MDECIKAELFIIIKTGTDPDGNKEFIKTRSVEVLLSGVKIRFNADLSIIKDLLVREIGTEKLMEILAEQAAADRKNLADDAAAARVEELAGGFW